VDVCSISLRLAHSDIPHTAVASHHVQLKLQDDSNRPYDCHCCLTNCLSFCMRIQKGAWLLAQYLCNCTLGGFYAFPSHDRLLNVRIRVSPSHI
jgi:hypothetical protein